MTYYRLLERMRPLLALVLAVLSFVLAISSFTSATTTFVAATSIRSPYLLIGGQNGTWFTPNQSPLLYQFSLTSPSNRANLSSGLGTPAGTVWTGEWNGSQWLISGWDSNTSLGFAPHIYLYDKTMKSIKISNYSAIDSEMKTWDGGDVFSVSFGAGHNWLLSGLGSGNSYLCGFNHMALGLFNGSNFIDLSRKLPCRDFILYTNAWNGNYWLVGGGYLGGTVLYKIFPNQTIVDLTHAISGSVSKFSTVTRIGWNGKVWMIGGMGFLAKYDGRSFSDLTANLSSAMGGSFSYPNSVNAIVWNWSQKAWIFGGGLPVAITSNLAGMKEKAWVVSYNPSTLVRWTNITKSILPSYERASTYSAVLFMAFSGTALLTSGYYNSNHALLTVFNGTRTDLTSKLGAMSYGIWIGAG